ncbi:endolytic transglycosylase MltG [Rhizobacter sp. AJA081-3]|uniref:endolytic transglycosylase MltG n=1 Tax=Rhizobacter sp. AJA081-3 TaxID=2753607 RepID=UPI001AE0AA09|nr:endolytic transglycosylase MltG [Rhizobacter sp. AJA081-3]QTN25180.1 endolytic transglycosylase MltG [Rhizobacter sp. AJA081-3]
MKWIIRLVVVLVIVALGAAGAAAWWLQQPLKLSGETVELSIEQGELPRDIAQGWVRAGVQAPRWALYEWFRWSGKAKRIRAGSYEIGAGTTPVTLLEKMVRGDETLATVRLIEGWTFRQFRAELAKADALKPTTAAMSDAQIMEALGQPGVAPEGRFYPDTYAYSKGSADLAVLKRALRAMRQRVDEAWAARAPDLPLRTPDEALTLASIVEKETGAAAERARIAAVFVNRLRIGMPLQTDPTVIYGLGEAFDGNLRKRDLQTDTPYNTYTRPGLPPTPIAMPGAASLRATVKPEASKALYFVARGDGSSEFSETLAEHNRAVNKYQRGR